MKANFTDSCCRRSRANRVFLMRPAALIAIGISFAAPTAANEIAGLAPYQRPVGAPAIRTVAHDEAWRARDSWRCHSGTRELEVATRPRRVVHALQPAWHDWLLRYSWLALIAHDAANRKKNALIFARG
jgi:hypothetical protein